MSTAKKKTTASRRQNRPSPRTRLLNSATKLFDTEGIRVIGIDRILRDADVAKASLYSLFGSKDALVTAYIEKLDEDFREDWQQRTAELTNVEDKLLAFFDKAIDDEPEKDFRGSHFLNAANEYPKPETDSERQIISACMNHRSWVHDTMTALLNEKNGYPSATQASQLLIFLDGGLAGARLTRSINPLVTARDLARQMLAAPPADYSI
ncbi:TetR/AcrR family transcriptional regulator [Corynebacterium pseudodiphtheriticum]|uniref:TetR/AcrR family transcriptional regulator n=1 Tax=Corynebacterium pseudodiphtheriticum TaxID=37637 RepID=UPI00234CEB4C|nr:TetR/AcrR family transcriptional regulator [Corynebacterium pseudodiphtheriticum]MDC7087386.1 TetR/AcrR family transcriptional regulator [Corynebacterium pseudodiphtheriticum]MDK4241769.1 TetR/AcrR family transcriptional regulator [Corynebacterium pseudodiphtheriticum]MDK8563139.1 TetR/AcrR family transcriptional regulator [Corynebacterium pseudodiphtheriticum]MDK8700877.1 TetR/AcrR family transcriptional regulator [Corynebacterium pseudodiphtheriticum]MDK8775513.1 TetR/AcrR family transcri